MRSGKEIGKLETGEMRFFRDRSEDPIGTWQNVGFGEETQTERT